MSTNGKPPFRVHHVRELTETTYVIRVDRHEVPARAGQCATVGVAGAGVNREYSLYSGDHEPYFDFLIKEVGQVSGALRRCRAGDAVDLDGPYGRFVIERPDDASRRYLFIATGVGIAPFHGFVSSYPGLEYTLVHGVRFLRERYDMACYPRERYISCVSREDGGDFRGRVTEYLKHHPAPPGTLCYLCGNNAMIAETYDLLRAQGVGGDELYTEIFF